MTIGVLLTKAIGYYRRWGARATLHRVRAELRLRLRRRTDTGFVSATGSISRFIALDDVTPRFRDLGRVAIHAHVFYPELSEEIARCLARMPVPFDLFVSVPDETAAETCRRVFSGFGHSGKTVIRTVVNRGRNVAPFVTEFARELVQYDIVAHLHTKRSPHSAGQLDDWRTALYTALFEDEDRIRRILTLLSGIDGQRWGLVYPQNHDGVPYYANTWLANRSLAEVWRHRLGLGSLPRGYFDYPVGFTFWARVEALRPLFEASIQPDDFAEEAGQDDGTLAHALERLLPMVVAKQGWTHGILPDRRSPSWSPWRIDRYTARERQELITRLTAPSVRLVIFDVFDTLLVRPLLDPESGKEIVARRLGVSEFPRRRAEAEWVAREKCRRDVGLDEVYEEYGDYREQEISALRRMEEQVEGALAAVRSDGVALMQAALAAGKRVVLASDTFLSPAFITSLLSRNGVLGYHALYVSSAVGVRKDNGALYRHVLENEGVSPSQAVMVGDNERVDLQIPDSLGLRTCHLLRPVELARSLPRFAPLVAAIEGGGDIDAELTLGLIVQRFFSQVFFQPPVDPEAFAQGGAEGIGYCVVGPIMASFVQWLSECAREDDVDALYFLSREGRLFHTVYERLTRDSPTAVPARYLVLSRRAITVPMIKDDSDIRAIAAAHYHPNRLSEFILHRYGIALSPADQAEMARLNLWPAERMVEVHEGWTQHLDPVLDYLGERIRRQAALERPGLLVYLKQMGLAAGGRHAVVDIGYAATIQGRLCSILERPIHGYYLLTRDVARRVGDRFGVTTQGYFGHLLTTPDESPLLKYNFPLEILLSSDEPQVVSYRLDERGNAMAEYRELGRKEKESAPTRSAIQRGVMAFIDDYLRIRRDVYPGFHVPASFAENLYRVFYEGMAESERRALSAIFLDDHYCGMGVVGMETFRRS